MGSEEAWSNGTDADPAADSTDVELAAEYFCIQVLGVGVRNCGVDVSAGAKKSNEVYRRTEGRIKGDLESNAFEDLCGESGERGHEEREGGEGIRKGWTERA